MPDMDGNLLYLLYHNIEGIMGADTDMPKHMGKIKDRCIL